MALDNLEMIIINLDAFDAQAELVDIIEDNAYEIEKLQRAQLAQGVDITGSQRVDNYTIPYANLKVKKFTGLGAQVDRVTFFATGDLYESLKTTVNGDLFKVESPEKTFGYMVDRIGEENYGLSPEQCETFATEITIPETKQRFHDKVFT